jgi:RNA polymerase sigma-70 factor, ECF subfamily
MRPASDHSPAAAPASNPVLGGTAPRQTTHGPNEASSADVHLAAFELAVRQSSRTLWSIAAAVLGRRNDAEDVVQEAVIVALGKRGEFSRVENFAAWMAQIVRFVALNRRRSARLRAAEGEEALQHVAAGTPSADAALPASVVNRQGELVAGDRVFDDAVMRALSALDETPRACLLLRVVNELSYREIGHALDIPEGTAMSHVFRARRALMERLAPVTDEKRSVPTPTRRPETGS